MRQIVTLGYFVRDEGGQFRAKRKQVIVDAPDGDGAAQLAIDVNRDAIRREIGGVTIDNPQMAQIRVFGVEPAPPESPVSEATKAAAEPPALPPIARINDDIRNSLAEMRQKNKGGRPLGSKNKPKADEAA